ncbi:hypothetical protein DFH29DRAFT_984904 [Suillus ampliporus]|nr:hypothetical protein DFH29DRAFT_984904 [Suillus ampliporus]
MYAQHTRSHCAIIQHSIKQLPGLALQVLRIPPLIIGLQVPSMTTLMMLTTWEVVWKTQDEAFMPAQGVQLGPLFRMFHPHLTDLTRSTGRKCDVHGNDIDQNAPPPPRTEASPTDWTPYESRVAFEAAEFLYTRNQMDLYETINLTPLGDVTWETFSMSYNGYDMWFRDPRLLVHHMLSNSDFATETEYDVIAEDLETHGSTFVPLIIGSDKTMVSVATGHTEYHPLYLSIRNIFNGVRRAHRNGVVLVGFLAIPKSTKEHLEDKDFRNFCRQMFHSSLAKIFDSVKPNMTVPDIVHCPDSHFRRVIYGLGPYIADYPEQLVLSGVVQNWCPKCLNHRKNLEGDGPSLLWCREHTDLLVQELQHAHLWYEYGIVQEVVDHLVDWVEEYLLLTHRASRTAEIMDDIDRRIAAVAPFAGLRRFPEGRGFKQWTGDDSKALMKVYLPAIKGHVPRDVVRAFSAFLDFCYIVRRDTITEDDLDQLQDALNHFHQYREIFKTTGVVQGFSFPHQHSLNHYSLMIRLYGAPNGLCSSITESKHIKAVKEPWRHSSRYKALGQMLLTNQRLDKIAAARSDFEARGMLRGSCISDALQALRNPDIIDGPTVQAHVELAATPVLGGARDVSALARDLELPNFPTMIQQFLHDQLHIATTSPPILTLRQHQLSWAGFSVFSSAAASFYAPSDLSGTGGMWREHIRATTSWRGGPARNDCIFVSMNDEVNCGLDGLAIARVLRFLGFKYQTKYLRCAVVHWFAYITDSRDPDTGMYLVAPSSNNDGTPDISIIHIDCIFRAAHLVPLYGANFLPREIGPHDSYNVFHAFYINKYADHHSFKVA